MCVLDADLRHPLLEPGSQRIVGHPLLSGWNPATSNLGAVFSSVMSELGRQAPEFIAAWRGGKSTMAGGGAPAAAGAGGATPLAPAPAPAPLPAPVPAASGGVGAAALDARRASGALAETAGGAGSSGPAGHRGSEAGPRMASAGAGGRLALVQAYTQLDMPVSLDAVIAAAVSGDTVGHTEVPAPPATFPELDDMTDDNLSLLEREARVREMFLSTLEPMARYDEVAATGRQALIDAAIKNQELARRLDAAKAELRKVSVAVADKTAALAAAAAGGRAGRDKLASHRLARDLDAFARNMERVSSARADVFVNGSGGGDDTGGGGTGGGEGQLDAAALEGFRKVWLTMRTRYHAAKAKADVLGSVGLAPVPVAGGHGGGGSSGGGGGLLPPAGIR